MTVEKKAQEYGVDLCAYCRECDNGEKNPCHHKKDAMHGYKDGFIAGQKETAVKMAQSALNVENKLRKKIEKLQNTIDYLKTCVSCVDYDCQRKRCILKDEVCKNFNKWRMPE